MEKQSIEELIKKWDTSRDGLTKEEAKKRLQRDGRNELKAVKPPTLWQRVFEQLREPMTIILLVAMIVSTILREYSDVVIIACVILINLTVGLVQQGKAERALSALQKMSSPTALVRRDGLVEEIASAELVVGDWVELEAGRIIPADLRLVETADLSVEESALTGESVPVQKDAMAEITEEAALGDRINMGFMSTIVTYGRGAGVVAGTGKRTEIGKISTMLESKEEELTPLQKRLADLGKILGIGTIIICLLLFGIAYLQGRDMVEMLMTAISLAVAAVPEGLPAVVTIVLAIGVQKMVKENSIVRRLPAVETLGAVSVVCTDKTGTLTQNVMSIRSIYQNQRLIPMSEAKMETNEELIRGMVLCCDASVEGDHRIGDPTELALVDMGLLVDVRKTELEREYPRVNERPFDSDRKLMTTVHQNGSAFIAYTKGAVDVLLERCTSIENSGELQLISDEDKALVLDAASQMSKQALRVLALARRNENNVEEESLIFVGLVGMMDPPRQEAKPAVERLRKAGVATVMITGDHQETALAIARELGIADLEEQCMTGLEVEAMEAEELQSRVELVRVFARVSPEHKVRIVEAFRASGKIVSMTGDGVNDAPSLKTADIGVAMGITGTDVAKNASDMILTDDNFTTIEKAVEEGRGIYHNIRKTVLFLLSSNLGEVVAMFTAIVLGLPAPLLAVHILWVNLVTDTLPALALGTDGKPRGLMKKPPRDPKASLFADGGGFNIALYGCLIALGTLSAFYLVAKGVSPSLKFFEIQKMTDILSNEAHLMKAQTLAFSILALSQLAHATTMRDHEVSVFGSKLYKNRLMVLAIFIGVGAQVLVTEVPFFMVAFHTSPLSLQEWGIVLAVSLLPAGVHEIQVIVRKLFRQA
jgi:Ca2+-transporting ATPase